MHLILEKKIIAQDIVRLTIDAPLIAAKAQAGQFVALMAKETSERIPLTLSDWNREKGTITLLFQKIGFSTRELSLIPLGKSVAHVLGPLGHATRIETGKHILCIGGGIGIAEVYPVCRAFTEAGNTVRAIIGARSKDHLILVPELEKACDKLFITTDDASAGHKGFVTDILKTELQNTRPGLIYAIGPVAMMQRVAEMTKPYGIKTIVSLNPIMVDATGMCGACRCSVNGRTAFACVDGPDFDAHSVDFEELKLRQNAFRQQESLAQNLKTTKKP